jgi:hypothetical protein
MLERECPCKARAVMLSEEDDDDGDGLMRRERVRMDLTSMGDGEGAGVAGMFGSASVAGVGGVVGQIFPDGGLVQRRGAMVRGTPTAHVGGIVEDVGTLLLWGLAAIGAYFVVKGKFRITAQTRR